MRRFPVKRFHSPSPQKPKKRVRGRLDFEKTEPKNEGEDVVYVTPTQKYFDKLQGDIVLQQSQKQEKEREIRELEESYGKVMDTGPKCTNCHTSGHNKSNCLFPHCVSASIYNDIKRHPDESKYVKEKKDQLKSITTKLNKLLEELKCKKRMYLEAQNTFVSQVQTDLIHSNQKKYLRKTLTGQSIPNWLAVNSDIRKLEKICGGKVPHKSEIQHMIKQFDEGFYVLQSQTDQSSSTAPHVNPVKALWEMKGIHFPVAHTVLSQQFPSELDGASSTSIATVSIAPMQKYGEPKSKSEEDLFLEMGLKKSLEGLNDRLSSARSNSPERIVANDIPDESQGLDLLFKAANMLDDLINLDHDN